MINHSHVAKTLRRLGCVSVRQSGQYVFGYGSKEATTKAWKQFRSLDTDLNDRPSWNPQDKKYCVVIYVPQV